MFETAASRVFFRGWVPAVILATAVSISLAGCALGPGSTASPTESSETTTAETPATEGTTMPSTEPSEESERTSNEIVTESLAIVRDLMTHSGGEYSYFDMSPFDPADTAGYNFEPCDGDGNFLALDVAGPASDDVDATQQQVVDAYRARGWEVTLRIDNKAAEGRDLALTMVDSTGKQFGYNQSLKATTILLQSECSTHPSLSEPST
jgi:hypothetical protein